MESFERLQISWRAPIGFGFSSPVVAQGRVFVTDSQISRPKARERVLCFDAQTGRSVWTHAYEVDYPEWALDPKSPLSPRPTPILSGGKIYALGSRGRLVCLQARDGTVLWEKNLENKNKDSTFTPSPLIEGNLLILLLEGLPPGPCVIAFDKDSGNEIWRALDEPATLSSPIVLTAAGKRQLIVWTQSAVTSLDPATGKLYWRERYSGGSTYAVPTPVTEGNLLFVNGMMFQLNEKTPAASLLWPDGLAPSRKTMSETSTAIFQGNHLFTCNISGELVCIEAKTGRIVWETNRVTEAKSGASIHITPTGKSALLFNDRGELLRALLGPKGYVEISRAVLLKPTWPPQGATKAVWAPPAFAGRHVFARNDEELVCAPLQPDR